MEKSEEGGSLIWEPTQKRRNHATRRIGECAETSRNPRVAPGETVEGGGRHGPQGARQRPLPCGEAGSPRPHEVWPRNPQGNGEQVGAAHTKKSRIPRILNIEGLDT